MAEGAPPEQVPKLYIANLAAMVATGALACGWLLFYTEWFPVVGGLLGLGGVFAWVAFVVGLLSEPRKKGLQAMFEQHVLLRGRTLQVCALAILVLTVLTAFSSTLVLDAEGDTVDRMTSIFRISDSTNAARPVVRTRVPARGVRRVWFVTPPWGRTLRVKVSGLPGLDVRLASPRRTYVAVPASFNSRALLLIRLDAVQSASAARQPDAYELRVTLGNRSESISPFAGQTVWIGAEDDVPIPFYLVRRWRDELMTDATAAASAEDTSATSLLAAVELVLARWDAPRAVFSSAALEPGDVATIEVVRRADPHTVVRTSVEIRPPRAADMVQEVVLQ